jgi:hypothetical protein
MGDALISDEKKRHSKRAKASFQKKMKKWLSANIQKFRNEPSLERANAS